MNEPVHLFVQAICMCTCCTYRCCRTVPILILVSTPYNSSLPSSWYSYAPIPTVAWYLMNVRLNEPPPPSPTEEERTRGQRKCRFALKVGCAIPGLSVCALSPRQKKNAFPKSKVHLKKVCYSAKHCKKSAVIFGSNLQKKQKWLEIRCDSPWNNIQTLVNRRKECIIYYQ